MTSTTDAIAPTAAMIANTSATVTIEFTPSTFSSVASILPLRSLTAPSTLVLMSSVAPVIASVAALDSTTTVKVAYAVSKFVA